MRFFTSLLLVGCLITPFGSYSSPSLSNENCSQCHSTPEQATFENSTHGSMQCVSCHEDFDQIPHTSSPKPVNCEKCHPQSVEASQKSKHGSEGTTCADCHGAPHEILESSNPKSPTFHTNIPTTCAVCHSDTELMEKSSLLKRFPVKSYLDTAHGKALQRGVTSSAVCTDCHDYHRILPPGNPESKIFRLNIPSTCGQCHEGVLQQYLSGIHGRAAMAGKWEAPICTDCHGEHTIRGKNDPESNLQSDLISEKVCAQCHAAERIITKYSLPKDRVETFFDSYHGLANKYGVGTVANCTSCHGAHGILPSTDPASSIYPDNLPGTCGKCHTDVSKHLAQGSVHLAPSIRQNTAVFIVEVFYILLIILVIGTMVFHNSLDFVRKCQQGIKKHSNKRGYLRFNLNERIQHSILAIIFILLAYTGFALRYSDAWWTFPFTIIEMGVDWRGKAHKLLAILFGLLAAFHVWGLLFSRRGRKQLYELLPRKNDLSDIRQTMRYNLGRSNTKPTYAWYSYIEKLEYWAVIWGAIIMGVTGVMMTFVNRSLHYFPKWVLDVVSTIHYYEAVLACLAILCWHFYFVIFDPEWYPMNLGMFTGIDKGEKRRPSKLTKPKE